MARYPDDSLQAVTDWWVEDKPGTLVRGRLIRAFIPMIDAVPYVLNVEGRSSAVDHSRANITIDVLDAAHPPKGPSMPVAGLPTYKGEIHTVERAKKRPAIVVALPGEVTLATKGAADWQTRHTMLVVPAYGCAADGSRAGWNPVFVTRIRRCEYPQYIWDQLPIGGETECVIRVDEMRPMSTERRAYELTDHRLTDDALSFLDEWIRWLVTGKLDREGLLFSLRRDFMARDGPVVQGSPPTQV